MTDYQPDFSEISEEYKAFVDKFKPRKTTDDCYTPDPVYAVVLDYVRKRYGVDPSDVVRPFWPGSDYQKTQYPAGCCVVDNPPFSILSRIVDWFLRAGIRFFLFAPALTAFVGGGRATAICCGASVTYANGAVVNTSFCTNMEPDGIAARSDPDLHDAVERASAEYKAQNKRTVRKLAFPSNLVTAASLNYLSAHHVEFLVRRSDCIYVRKLDNYPSGIFGGGFLLAERAAAERAAAERVALSDRERRLVAMLSRDKDDAK